MVIKSNSTVCFLGDSITANGGWIARVAERYAFHHPKKHVRFYNCGVAGTTAATAINGYLYEECLSWNPNYVYICYGINDIDSNLYKVSDNNEDKIKALKKYRENLTLLIKEITAFGAVPVLMTPPAHNDKATGMFCNEGLLRCVEIQHELSELYSLENLNLYTPFEARMTDPITSDGTHPNTLGDSIIATVLLEHLGISENVDDLAARSLSETNQKRFLLEKKIRLLAFVRWQMGLHDVVKGQYLVPEHISRLLCEANQHIAPWSEDVYRSYCDVIYTEMMSRADLVKLTVAVAAGK